jgi:hypothetical protein
MAVEVIGQDESKRRQATCGACGAVLAFYPEDVQSQALCSVAEYDGTIYYVVCPACKAHVCVDGP